MSRRYTGGFLSSTPQATDTNSANGIYTIVDAQEKTAAGLFPAGNWTPQRSLRFRSSASAYLNRTPSTTGNRKTWTWSGWVKRSSTGATHILFTAASDTANSNLYEFRYISDGGASGIVESLQFTGPGAGIAKGAAQYRDPSSWYHVMCVTDTTQASQVDRCRIYVNGVAMAMASNNLFSLNEDTSFNMAGYPMRIGSRISNNTLNFDGYLAEVNFIDGQALDPTYFGANDPSTGVWVPKRYTGTYGTNGFYLPFSNNTLSTDITSRVTATAPSGGTASSALTADSVYFTSNVSSGSSFFALKYDFGTQTQVTRAYVGAAYFSGGTSATWAIWGSNDDTNYTAITSFGVTNSGANYSLNINANFRYYYLRATNFGTNGSVVLDSFLLYQDGLGLDSSTAGNNWTPNNFSLTTGPTYDSVVDVPGIASTSVQTDIGGVTRGNYATFNPLYPSSWNATLSNGNQRAYLTPSLLNAFSTMPLGNDKYYWEITWNTADGDALHGLTVGIEGNPSSSASAQGAQGYGYYNATGNKYTNSTATAYGSAWYSSGTYVIGIAYDGINRTITFYLNGVSQGVAFSGIPQGDYYPAIAYGSGAGYTYVSVNFGQRAFAYTPPTGYKSLCTTNLPTPTITNPSNYFDVKGYYGTGDTQTIGAIQKQTPGWPIKNSLRFRQSNGAHFTRTTSASAATNSKIWTYSVWAKKQITNIPTQLFSASSGTSTCQILLNGQPFDTDGTLSVYDGNAGSSMNIKTSTLQRDPNQWHHYVIAVDTTQATAANRVLIYVDGILQPLSTATYPSQNVQCGINNASTLHGIGCQISNGIDYGQYWEGFMAESNFVDGQQLTPKAFGSFDANGNWVPQKYNGSYGNNGFYLNFSDNTQYTFSSNAGLGKDFSGNNNYFTSYGFSLGGTTVQSLTTVGSGTWVAPSNVTSVNAVIIAGGGGGGSGTWTGGGGGAGGVLFRTFSVTPGQSYSYTVGGGGGAASTGGDSIFNGATAKGGGAGASSEGVTAGSGGSGGGGAPATGSGGSAYQGQGNQGGNGATTSQGGNGSDTAGAGGGGYTYRASNLGYQNSPGYGAPGFATHITGAFSWYAAGGCGGGAYPSWNNYGPVTQHIGGGGGSRYINYGNTSGNVRGATNPVANTGAGGGGCTNGNSGTGGASGIIILSYNTGTDSTQQDYDVSVDSPTDYANNSATADTGGVVGGNYCVWDSSFNIRNNGGVTPNWWNSYDTQTPDWQPGTCVYDAGSSAVIGHYVTYGVRGTTPVKSGKWYWEVKVLSSSLDQYNATYAVIGIDAYTQDASAGSGYNYTHVYRATDGYYQYPAGSINQSFGATYTANDVIGVALDLNAGTLSFYKNNVLQGTISSNIQGKAWVPFIGKHTTGAWTAMTANFGDRAFKYTPPAGFKSLNSANIIAQGASAGTFAGGPDLVWIKQRSGAQHHVLFDSVRGAGNILQSSSSANTSNDFNTLAAFRGSGFQLGQDTTYTNIDGQSYVAWAWKKGKIPGFDIVVYGGDGVSNRDVPHSLGQTPAMVWNKTLNGSNNWRVICKGMTSGYNLQLDSSGTQFAVASSTNGGLGDLNSSSTFRLANGTTNNSNVNGSNNAYLTYLWAEVPGFSKFGVYQGNNSTDGPFVYCGFRPKYIMVKPTDYAEQWFIHDTVRDTFNPTNHNMWANSTGAEDTYAHNIDLLSNGFKLRQAGFQNSSNQFIYMAFAEAPFKYANAR